MYRFHPRSFYPEPNYLSLSMTKPIKWPVCPAKTQISLGIHPVWSEYSLSAWRKVGSLKKATHKPHSEDSDQTGRMPRLIWVFAGRTCHFVGFVIWRLICFQQFYSNAPKFSFRQILATNEDCPWRTIHWFINSCTDKISWLSLQPFLVLCIWDIVFIRDCLAEIRHIKFLSEIILHVSLCWYERNSQHPKTHIMVFECFIGICICWYIMANFLCVHIKIMISIFRTFFTMLLLDMKKWNSVGVELRHISSSSHQLDKVVVVKNIDCYYSDMLLDDLVEFNFHLWSNLHGF